MAKPYDADEPLRPIIFTAGEAAALLALGKLSRDHFGPPPPATHESIRSMVRALNKVVAAMNNEPEVDLDPD